METENKRTYSKRPQKNQEPETIKENEVVEVKAQEPKEEPIGYGFWFTIALRDGRVNFWQDKEIFVFFKNRGLTDRELRSKYDEMLKLY